MEPDLAPMNILLVDDRPENLLVLETVLGPLGQRLVRAQSGQEALRHLLAADYAVILLDVRMPVMDGYATAELVRSRERSRTTPIIFLTAHKASELQVFQGYASGAVDFLTKPFPPQILRSKVQVFVEMARNAASMRRMNRELERLNLELKAANGELEAFSHSVSHDLRAPLRHIDGFLDLLEPHLAEPGREHLGRARAASRHMVCLIEGLLGFARVTRQEMRHEAVDLGSLVASVVAELRLDLGNRAVRFDVGRLPRVQGDLELLRAAFYNLLQNAVKFTRNRPVAEIEVTATEEEGEHRIHVKDNGVGFDPGFSQDLFGAFKRLHPHEGFEGTGIGLANVKRIILRHRGRVWAEGDPGRGARFHLALPGEGAP